MKKFTGQKKLILGSLSVITGDTPLKQYETHTDTVQLSVTSNTN